MGEIPRASSPASLESSDQINGRRRLFDNIACLYALQGLNSILPLFVLPYLVRTLGVEEYGLLAFAQSFAQYFTVVTDYGFNFSATRQLAKEGENKGAVSRLFSSVLIVKVSLMIIGAVVLAAVVLLSARFRENAWLYSMAYFSVLGNVLFPVWFYQGLQRMRYVSIVSAISKLISVAAVFVFVHSPGDVVIAVAIQSAGMVIAGMLGLLIAIFHFKVSIEIPSLGELKGVINDGWHLFVSTAAISLYTNTNVFLVGLLGGNVQAGYFSAAERLIRAVQGLTNPLNQALFPHVNSLLSQSREVALTFMRTLLKVIGIVMLVLSVALFAFSHWIVAACFGPAGIGIVPVLRWIAFLPLLIGISNILGIQTMIPMGMDRQFTRIVLVAGLLNIALAIPLILFSGAQGAASAVFISELFVTVTMTFLLHQKGVAIIPTYGVCDEL